MRQLSPQYLHFGGSWCGPAPLEFANLLLFFFERLPLFGALIKKNQSKFPPNVLRGNIASGLPIRPGSVSAAYCSHVLEHLTLSECQSACLNVFRYLRDGGVFRLVMPDLHQIASSYVAGNLDSVEFMARTSLGVDFRPSGLVSSVVRHFGNSRHLWMWDYSSMSKLLTDIGFRSIRPANFGDSSLTVFSLVEEEHRWNGEPTFGLEAMK